MLILIGSILRDIFNIARQIYEIFQIINLLVKSN